ncbi:MAG TPA: hypothetical protein VGQ65_00680 [Thermoanaerobaculia bacterium]|jgi:hypothetical protein|nr:hypothetical protein [Thermoanaerobaculia bacterium]
MPSADDTVPHGIQPDNVQNSERRPLTMTQAARAYWETLVLEMGRAHGTQPTWEGILRLEEIAIHALPAERLIRRAWIIRNRYREVAGEAKYSLYTASNPPALSQPAHGDAAQVDVEALRADLLEVHRELTREYIFGNALEHQRGQLSRRATIVGLCALFLLAVTLGWSFLPPLGQQIASGVVAAIAVALLVVVFRRSQAKSAHLAAIMFALAFGWTVYGQRATTPASRTPVTATVPAGESTREPEQWRKPSDFTGRPGPATTLTMIVMAGVLGATFSLIRRAQTPAMDGDAMRNVQNLAAADTYFFLTPLTGAIGALVLYAFFCGGLLEGTLFPRIACPPGIPQPMRFMDFLLNADPVSWPDQGKALVWCFIAGFAERLVPDAIDRLTSAAQKK